MSSSSPYDYSTPKKRTKSKHRNTSSGSSPLIPLLTIKEPSPGFFPSKQEILKLLGVLTIAFTVAITCNYMTTSLKSQPKPYCDSSIGGLPSDYNSLLLDDSYCEPCPEHGECISGNLECVSGYKKQGRSCVEDGEINQTAKELSKWIEKSVCEASVRCLCDGIGTVWVPEAHVFKEIDEQEALRRKFGLKDEAYVLMKQKAMESVDRLLETRKNLQGRVKELKCPDALVEHYKPVSCYVRHWVIKNVFYIVPVCVLIGGLMTSFVMLMRKVRRRRYLSNRGEELYEQICDILEEKAMMAKGVPGGGEPWVVASWLRDDLLLPRERKDSLLWKKVEELVQEDSRLDQYPKLVRGESKVVWEWQVEGSLSSSRSRTKGKASKQTPNGRLPNSPVPIAATNKSLCF
ncbi:hypothetical protein MKW94_021808 [Papaver nudicaule]|uniref:Man1/Src1-like C-terminal domain-containing protein n=1 Tax=Papaver nudicaule TaxID=74823 RepID=A0AA41V2E8_PAPNU|nr:hypothetical protein [Papaver nudicaule]